MRACPKPGRGVDSARGRRARRPMRSNRCPRSLDCLYFYGRASWAFGSSRRRPSCKAEITVDAGRGCPGAARGCRDKSCPRAAAARSAGRLLNSRWRGRAPPAAGELLGEETRQIVSPIFAVEFWAQGGVLKTPLGAPARAARALASATSIGFRLRILESKIAHPQLTAAPRGLSRRRGSRKGAAAGLPPGPLYERQHTETKWEPTPTARRRREEAPRAPQPWASSLRPRTRMIKTSRPRVP